MRAMAALAKKKDSLSKDLIWNLTGQFVYLFGLWLITVLTTNLIGYEAQGILALALAASNICSAVASYFLRLQYAADIEERFSDTDYILTRFILTGISVGICFVYCLALQYSWTVIGIIMLYYVYKVLEYLSDIYHGCMLRHKKLYLGGMTSAAKGILSAGIFAGVAMWTHSLVYGILAMNAVALLILVADVFLCRKVFGFRIAWDSFHAKTFGRILVICFPLMILLVCSNTLPSLPRIFFEKMYSKQELGYYASIANIAVLIQTAATSIVSPLVPKISKAYKTGDTKGFLKIDGIIIGGLIALVGLACIVIAFAGEWALVLIYKEEIRPYAYTFLPAIVAAGSTAMVILVTQILGAMEKRVLATISVAIGVGICAAISYPLCLNLYMNGMSVALIIAQGATSLIGIAFILIYRKPKNPMLEESVEQKAEEE